MTRPAIAGTAIIVVPVAAILIVFLLIPPVAQDPAYHQFADTRSFLGVNNFLNVASNLPFLVVGVWGLLLVGRHGQEICLPGLHAAYIVFFSGILLTALGSGYYHLDPANGPLVWDRLPMTIGFAGFFSIIVGEFVSVRVARRILIPFLLIGYASVEYWAFTESIGAGDLRAYAVIQFLPMLLVPVILLKYQPAIGASRYFWIMLAFYVFAKIFEQLDVAVFATGQLISGHSIKHLLAALAPATLLYALLQRRRV